MVSEELINFLNKKINSIAEEVTFAIKGLKGTKYETHPIEEIWEIVYRFTNDSLVMLRSNDINPLLTTIQNYARTKTESGFRVYEPVLAFLTAQEVILNKIKNDFSKNDPQIYYQSACQINNLFKIIVINLVEALNYHMTKMSSVPKLQKFPAWLGDKTATGKVLE